MRSGSRASRPNAQLHPQTAFRLARAEEAVQHRIDAVSSGSRCAARSRAQRISERRSRTEPGAGARGRRAHCGGRGAAAYRHTPGAQGHFLCQRLAHHLRLEHARQLRQPLRRACGGATQRGRGGDPGQDQHGRVCDGFVQRNRLLGCGEKSLGPGAGSGRLQRRFGRGRGRAHGTGGDRHRYRRVDSPARRFLRHLRPQAHLWRGVALRHDRVCLQPGPGRADREKRRGPRADAERDGRFRCARLDQPRAAGRGLRARARSRPHGRSRQAACRLAHRRAQGVFRRRPRQRRRGCGGGGSGPVRETGRAARCHQPAQLRLVGSRLLRDRAGRGIKQSVAFRRRALRLSRSRIRRPRRHVPQDPGAGLRRRGETAHPHRHLRAVARLLRRLLSQGAENPPADCPGFR